MDAVARLDALLRPDVELTPRVRRGSLAVRCAQRKLTFGDRVHCPFLRPFFLTAADETRIRTASPRPSPHSASGWWRRRWRTPRLLDAARRDRGRGAAGSRSIPATRAPAPPRGSTRSCCRTRCTSPSTTPSRRPASAYTQRLCELFDALRPMTALPARRRRAASPHDRADARRRCSRATATGAARAIAADHRDRRLARACRPGPSSRSCATPSSSAGVPTVVCDPRELTFDGGALTCRGTADRSGLPPRADQRHRRAPGRLRRRSSTPTSSARSASRTRSAASCRTRRRSSPC